MTTKPEGPAQEPQCPMCGYTRADAQLHMDHHLCKNAGNAPWEATPTPSQPAGAREAEAFVTKFARERHVKFPETWDFIYELLDAFLAQQTAAKDADEPTPQEIIAAYDRAIKDKQAAERERDSLRVERGQLFHQQEALQTTINMLSAENAALKAGKDGQK